MEIAGSSRYWIDSFWAYTRTRMTGRMHLAALFLFSGSLAAGQRLEPIHMLLHLIFGFFLVFQFRLWDDLASLDTDRLRHPHRVLSASLSLVPFYLLLISLVALNSLWLHSKGENYVRLSLFLAGSGVLFLWYRNQPKFSISSVADFHIVLLKYPLMVYLLSDPTQVTPLSLLFAMLVVYLCFCIYEFLHDKTHGTIYYAKKIAAWEVIALMSLSLATLFPLTSLNFSLALGQGLILLLIAGCLAWSFRPQESFASTGLRAYFVFVIGFLQLLIFTIGGPV